MASTRGKPIEQYHLLMDLLFQGQSVLYEDDCLKLRNKMTSVFGPAVAAKFNLSQGTQKITKALHMCDSK